VPRTEVSILQGDTFVVSDENGDLNASHIQSLGFFHRDMRHLSRWQLRLNGRPLDVLSVSTPDYDEAMFFLVESVEAPDDTPPLSLVRRREVASGMMEQFSLHNHTFVPVSFELSVLFDADFADIHQVTRHRSKQGTVYRRREGRRLTLGYQREDFCRETHIEADGAYLTEQSLTFRAEVGAGQNWSGQVVVGVGTGARSAQPRHIHTPQMPATLDDWLAQAPRVESDWYDLRRLYQRSLVDLAALRFYSSACAGASLPAAGLPWFMALFGRDSLITSYQTLPFLPEMARTTLRALAAQQAGDWDDFRDAEPGKILHELRQGELVRFAEQPQSPYYGSADSTPLFLIVLDEYEQWTGDQATVRELEPAARAALEWMDRYGDLDHDGYLEYQSRNTVTGLVNQCWKDSWNSISHPDGRLASLPRATCELQGYAYDAWRRTARLAREIWRDSDLAQRLDSAADALRARFNVDFWLPDEGFYALALDGEKQPVKTLSSNIGHLLWSGIVPPDRVGSFGSLLCGHRLFSGWGVRTVADGQVLYNPIGYHNGTVWPHDTAFAAAGLARYGMREEATRLAMSMLEAGRHLDFRLPEALAGYPRAATLVPVHYPTACSPQAWAAGAPLLLLRVLLGLQPGPDGLKMDPHLAGGHGRLALYGLHYRGTRTHAVAGEEWV
jgi:glycogen debranching enzyme